MNASSGNVTVYGNNLCGNGTETSLPVTVNPVPPAPVITASWGQLISDAPAGNQWYFEGTIIPGATGQYYNATQIGHYWDVVTLNSCSSDTSNHIYILIIGIRENSGEWGAGLYPNPGDGLFSLQISSNRQLSFDVLVYNNLGVMVRSFKDLITSGSGAHLLDLRSEPDGVYTIVFRNEASSIIKKVIINK
jgi:hypothetical protein